MSLIREEINRVREIMGLPVIKEQVEIPADTSRNMKNNVYKDFWNKYDTMTYCNFLEYWKNKYNEEYSENNGGSYEQSVKDAFEKHKTSKLPLRLLNTFAWIENRGREKGDNGQGCWGLFQYCRPYWSDYGITSQEDAENADIATRQFVKHATSLGNSFSSSIGVDVFAPENQWLLYLVWQQGSGGIRRIYNNCEDTETFKGDKIFVKPELKTIGPKTVGDIEMGKDTLQRGDSGDLVKYVQLMLVNDYSIDLGESGPMNDGIDGKFLDIMEDGVKEFQERFNLVVDGVVGRCTLETIVKGRTPRCCRKNACKKDNCKDSVWCSKIKKDKEKITKNKKKDDKEVNVNNVTPGNKLPGNFAEIPGGQGNFRCEQPTLKELAKVFEDYPDIERVVRMNNEEGTGVEKHDEKAYVESTGREYIWFNAHDPYRGGRNYETGYTGAVEKGLNELNKGNTLIHCTHGADRTGFVVAAYIKERLGWSNEKLWDYTTQFNGWDGGYDGCCANAKYRSKLICNATNFVYYLSSFYPIKEWCEAKEARMDCKVCKKYK